ncbi:MAG: amidase [Nocardioides sp.]|nr:amidase [Nocardioides sp.]
MPGPKPESEQLVPGDQQEATTRRDFGLALAASLPLVNDLSAADPEPRRDAAPQGPGPGLPWATPADLSPLPEGPARREAALESGWLVTAAPPTSASHGALHGLEVAVKDLIDVAGLPVRNGTPGGLWRSPASSAPAWQVLEAAGARCIGKAATHEMAWGVTTPAIGNPADPDRSTGGSSGGSAACVAGGAAHGALGTDTGGSIRIPAALCGVVGIRPTHGSISLEGITALAPSQDVVGPLARDVATCAAMLAVMTERPLGLNETVERPLRVGVLRDPGRLDADVDAAYRRTLTSLARGGVEIVECETSLLRDSSALSVVTMLAESASLHGDAVRAAPHLFGGEARALLTLGANIPDADLLPRARRTLRHRTGNLFSHHRLDGFLTPTTSIVAPTRGAETVILGERRTPVATALSRYSAWSSATGWPAVSVPVQTGGLPVGMQFMTPPHREDRCLELAATLESHQPHG